MISLDEHFPIMTQELLDTIPMKGFQIMPLTKNTNVLLFVQEVSMRAWTIHYLKELK